MPIYYFLTRNNVNHRLRDDKNEIQIIVSLTSFPNRINRLWIVIETIMRQTLKPDKIILWLSKEQFSSFDSLPKKLRSQCLRGLEIRLVDGDIRSHKKYFYTLKEFPCCNMITIDDDIFYRSNMIEDLITYSVKYPFCIISQYSSEISWTDFKLDPYFLWKKNVIEKEPNFTTFFGSGGGTLFPPNSLFLGILNKDLFMELAPTADDIWLNAMSRLNNTKVVATKYYSNNIPVLNFNNITLESINNGNNQNDIQINSVRNFYIKNINIDPFSIKMN